MKLEISALEHSCFEAKKIQEEETAEENTRMSLLIQDLELFNVWDAKKTAEFSEMENKELRKKLDTHRRQILGVEKMSRQIEDYEVLTQGGIIKTIDFDCEELKEEKLKANEEAEDLAQEMAEFSLFRYTDRMTGLLEEECKHRACIEQASLHRIAELEAQNGPNPLPLSDIFMNAEDVDVEDFREVAS
ncbi:hypothetical protein DVH24_008918 [Malus domestica]|uniref:Uncharacterized protein n=1 Tax=Malus domestica TaxID=3750 RepID=A0A498JRE7_MALDO|nr:hypothetical protein DVH24_008918 [Malus domestica]